jgi:hypothetical protein
MANYQGQAANALMHIKLDDDGINACDFVTGIGQKGGIAALRE